MSPTANSYAGSLADLSSSFRRFVPHTRHVAALVAALLFAGNPARAESAPAPLEIAVVVGRASHVTHVSKDELRELYLRRQRLWPNGERAIPVNLPPDNSIREQFSKVVLGRSTHDLVAYWNARYFEGITPPITLSSPAAIRAYLKVEPGAIAYLPVAEADDACRTLLVLGR
jgi:hypothetical protein